MNNLLRGIIAVSAVYAFFGCSNTREHGSIDSNAPHAEVIAAASNPCQAPGACAETKQATAAFTRELKLAMEKGETNAKANFPATPVGNMARVIYARLVVPQVTSQQKFSANLDRIGWSWVWTPESVVGQNNIEESLRRAAKVRPLLVSAREETSNPAIEATLAEIKPYAKQNAEAQMFYDNFARSVSDRKNAVFSPSNELAYKVLEQNIDALEEALTFLKSHTGKYSVNESMEFDFDRSVSSKEVEQFSGMVARLIRHEQQIASIADAQAGLASRWSERMDQALQVNR